MHHRKEGGIRSAERMRRGLEAQRSQNMIATDTQHAEIQNLFAELDYRDNDGIEVSLVWNRADNSLTVFAYDSRTDERLSIAVHPAQAREVFLHPYAYAA
jgi:hypothetical protein